MNRYYDNKLDMSCFVQSLLAYGMEHNRITATQLQKVQNELFDVTQNEWMKYVDDRQELELSVEKMDQIFQSVCYRIGVGIQYEIYEKEQKIELSKNKNILSFTEIHKFDTVELCNKALDQLVCGDKESLKEIGTNYILDLLSAVKYKFELLKEDYIPVEHDGYHNFYEKQFIEVIEEYHPYWKAHSSIGSFDYHLCIEDISSIGIEFYAEYLIRLEQEEILLKQFDQSVICDLLTVCVHGESDSQINLYECVLLQVIGLMLLEKPWKDVDSLFLNENEKEELYFRYKEYDLLELREEWGNVIKKKLSNIPFTNWIYVEETISYILMRIYMSMEHQTVKELWQSANDAIKMENIQDREYNLPTKELKKVIGMIQDCDLIREKIAIIQTRIHSIDDLIEVLSEAVFGEEVIALFQQLSEKQLGELLRYVLSQSDRYDLYERDKMPSWHMELLMYLNGLSQESKDRIQADN